MRSLKGFVSALIAALLLLSCAAPLSALAAPSTPPDVLLTDAELACVAQSKETPVTVGIIPNLFPMSSFDSESGEFSGIIIDMLKLVSKHTGLELALREIELSRASPVRWLKEKNTRLIAGILKSPEFLSDRALSLSAPMFDGSIMFVGRKGDNFIDDDGDKTIAILNGFQVATEYVREHFPNYEILFCPTTEDCLSAVVSGKADATLHNKYGLNYLLQNPHYDKLEMIHDISFSLSNCVAALAEDDPVLMSIINKGLDAVSDEEYNYVLISYTVANAYKMTLSDVLYKYRAFFAVIAVLLLVILACLAAVAHIRQKNTVKLRAAYAQTKEALAAAERASEAKGQFTSRMSHEIRTPLNAVMGYISIAKSNLSNPQKVGDCLSKSELAAKHLLGVINDVLDMSSIESGKIKIANSAFDLRQLISAATSIYYSQAKQNGVTFDVLLTDVTREKLIGDGLRLNQVLMNLLSNALKFTPEGGSVRLTAEQLITRDDTIYMRFTVSDTGIGMSEDFLRRLFSAYEQESAEIAQNYGGSGLGLAITKNLVTMMGGSIHAESEKGKGSVFSVELPFGVNTADAPPTAQQYDFSGLRALIADADAASQRHMRDLFDRCGVHTHFVASGGEALAELSRGDACYDLCLLDVCLPDLGVTELMTRIHALALASPPIFIAVTYDYSEISDEVMRLGLGHAVTKPLFQSTMFDLLVDLYGRASPAQTADPGLRFDGKRLLLAEDNEMNREIATDILSTVGFEIDPAQNGRLALELFLLRDAGYYDAILMDIQMPEMNGYEAARAIRLSSHPQAATIPIIAMTANAFSEDVSAALAAGMNDHVAKPIDTNALYSTLGKYLGGST
ncbi:MAG: response regulator [Oscillospiraceae bacterium]